MKTCVLRPILQTSYRHGINIVGQMFFKYNEFNFGFFTVA